MATVATGGVGGMGLGRAKLHTLNPKPPSLFCGKKLKLRPSFESNRHGKSKPLVVYASGGELMGFVHNLFVGVGVGLPCTVMECGDMIYRSTLPRSNGITLTVPGVILALGTVSYLWATPGVAPGFWDMFVLAFVERLFRPTYRKNDFVLGKKLGEGAFGVVYRVSLAKNPSSKKEGDLVLKKATEYGAVEIWMNERVRRACSSSCADFLYGFLENSSKKGAQYWLLWQFEGEATLSDLMLSKDFPYNVEAMILGEVQALPKGLERESRIIQTIMRQLLFALDGLHTTGIVHRDIKPQNIIFSEGSRTFKIIDLGAAADLRVGINYIPKEFLLDPRYAAPEQYIMSTQTPSAPSAPVATALSPVLWQMNLPDRFDIYSAGLIFLQMAFPSLRSDSNLIQFNRQLKRCEYDLVSWRKTVEPRASLELRTPLNPKPSSSLSLSPSPSMLSVATRRTPLLKWTNLGLRNISSGRLRYAPSTSESPSLQASDYETPVAGTKVLESFTEEFEIGLKKITLETGKIARFANGAVVLAMEETKVLSTVASAKGDAVRDFLPLTVDYQEKQFAQGVIPTTFMRREGAPKERELLCGRLIDRPIRPLFPAGFYHEVQVMASVLSSDGKQDPDIMAANATSVALMLSDIPWGGPIGMIRIGRISGEFIVNPSMDELNLSDLNLVYACTKDKTLMIDVQAREISERDLEAALRLAHPEAVKYLEPQIRLAARAGKQKKEYKLSMMSEMTLEKVRNLAEAPIEAVFTDPTYGKFERGEALDRITQDVRRELEEEGDEESLKVLSKTVDTVRKGVVRRRIIAEGLRVDGRRLDEVRPLFCEAGNLPQLHGSSLFSRGDTQVLCTVTLGAPGDAQRLVSIVGPSTKRFMLHYSFPPFCINEVGKRAGLNRREVGHGTLAEKALLAVLPPENDLRYAIRINSEVMASDGSTSMATVCGGSMALMDAGIPLREHVAGVSVGLVTDVDPSTGIIKDYRILTDILGLEDHLGDMDFKIAGTRNGITAIQLDIKPAGIPLDIVCESLEPAFKARLQILDHMEREINAPRTLDERNSPRIVTLKYSNDNLRRLIGPLGALKRKIEEETGARISVNDGSLTIVAKNHGVLDKVLEKVDFIIGCEIEVGGVYRGIVTSIKEYGAFLEFNGGQQGLLHISELSHEPVSRVSDVVSIGQQLLLKCIAQDLRGNINLSLKETLPRPRSGTNNVDGIEGSLSQIKQETDTWASVGNLPTEQNKQHSAGSKHETSGVASSSTSPPSILIRSAAECDEEEKSAGLKRNSKGGFEAPMNAKSLKIGMQVTAKVHQIRARGLVLDLGGGIRGMYRFETNGKRDFEVGDELRVKCSSFSSKGIPVMSTAEDD